MPEDVSSPHPARELVSSVLNPPSLSEASKGAIQQSETRGVLRISWAEIQKRVGGYVAEVKKENPDIPEAEVEMVADLLFGPFRIDQKAMGETKSDEESRLKGAIQHNLVHAVVDAQTGGSSDEFVNSVYNTVSFLDRLARTDAGKDSGLYLFHSGMRAELAVTQGLIGSGYNVTLPDYAQDTAEIEDSSQDEVMEWDVKSGVDLLAEGHGRLLLVNSKGQYFLPGRNKARLLANAYLEPTLGRVPSSIVRIHRKYFDEGRVRRAVITAPTAESEWSRLPGVEDITAKRRALSSYGLLPHLKDDIIRKIKRF